MTTNVKTTVTFTFTYTSMTEDGAIRSLRSWFAENTDGKVQLVKDSDTGEYTYLNTTDSSVGTTFKFKTPAEFIEKFCAAEGMYAPVRALLDYANSHCTAATTETIEVEEDK